MDVIKLVDKIMEKIELYEEERKKEENEILYEFYGTRISELRFVICDICDWAIEEHREEINRILKGVEK